MDNPVLNNIIPPTIDGNVLDNSVLNDSTPVLPGVVSTELPQESNIQTIPNTSFKSKSSGQTMVKRNTNKDLLTSRFFETPVGLSSSDKSYSSRATTVNEKQEYDKKHNYYSNPESTNYALEKIVDNYQPVVKTIQRQEEIANEVSGKFNSSKFLDGMKANTEFQKANEVSGKFNSSKFLDGMKANTEFQKANEINGKFNSSKFLNGMKANAEFQKANEIDYKGAFLKLSLTKFQIQKSIPNVLNFKDTSPLDKLIISKLPKTTLVDNVMKELVKVKGNKYLMYKPAVEKAVSDVQGGRYNDYLDNLGFSKTIEIAIDDNIRDKAADRERFRLHPHYPGTPFNTDLTGADRYSDTFNTNERRAKFNQIAQIDSAMKELIELNYANSIKNNNIADNTLENLKTTWDKLTNITNSVLIPYVKGLTIKNINYIMNPTFMITDGIYDLSTLDSNKPPDELMAAAAIINMGSSIFKSGLFTMAGINYRSAEGIGNYKPISLSNTFNLNPNSLVIDMAEIFGKYGALAPDLVGDIALNIARDFGAVEENVKSLVESNVTIPDASEGTSYFAQAYYNKIREQRGSLYPTNELDKNVVVPAEQMVASVASFIIELYALSPIFKALAAPIGRAGIAMGGSELSLLEPAATSIWGEIAATGTNRVAMGLLSASKYAPAVLGGLAGGYIEGITVGDETYNNVYRDLVVNQGYSEEEAHIQAMKGRNIATGLNTALIAASNAIQLGHVFKAGKQFLIKSEMKAITKELLDSGMSLEQAITEASIKTLKKHGNPESIMSIAKIVFADGGLEFIEESFLNTISQLIGESFTDAKRRNEDGSIKSTFDTLFSWDNLSQGVWGFIGGSGTNIVMTGINGGKVEMQKLNDKGERIYLDDANKETTEFTFNPKLEEVNYNGWNIERIIARQTADGIMMNFANDNFVMNKLSTELETLANQEGSTDRTIMMEHIKNEIFNIGLLRSVETGLSPYVKMQYEQIANLTPQQAVALGLAVNEKDTSYKTRANEAIAKYESIEGIFKGFETKFGKHSSFFDGLAHTKAKLKTFEYLKQNELDLLQREIDDKRKDVDKLKRRRKLDGAELQPLFDLYEKENTLKNESIELEQKFKLLSDRKANNTSPLHDPATGSIEDELKVIKNRIEDISDETDLINEKIKTTGEEIINRTIVKYNGKSITYGQMYSEIESLANTINTKVEKENKLRNDIKSLETEIEQRVEEFKLKEEQFNSDIELTEDSNKKALRIKKKTTLRLLEVDVENKTKKLKQLIDNNKILIDEINDGNKELTSLKSEFKKQNTKLEHTNATISKWQSELRKEVVGYGELLSRKAKGEASINTARGVFDNIHKLSKSAYNKKQIDSLFREVDNHRMSKLHAIMALNIAIEAGTISSEVLSKDRLANLITDLNWEDFSNASKTKQGLYAQQVKHYIRLLKRLKSEMLLIHGPIAIKMLEDKLNNIKDLTGDTVFDNYKKLVTELLDGIKAEVELRAKQLKDAKTDANNQIDLINGNTLDSGLSNAIDEVIKNDYNFTPQGWLKLLNKLREVSKDNIDEFKEFKIKYEKSILALLEKAKPNLSFILYHDIQYTFSEEFQNENKKYEYSDIKTFIASLQKVEPSALIDSMLSTILIDTIQPLLILEEERMVLLQNPEANEAEIEIIEDEEIRIFDGLLEDIQKYISEQTLYLNTLLVADENYIVNDLIDKSTIIAYIDELQKLREYTSPIIDSFLNEIDFNDNAEAKSKMLDEAKTKIDFTFNELSSLFELSNKLKETLKSEESTDVEEESEVTKQFEYILTNGSLSQVDDNYINERLNSDTLDKAFYNSLSEAEMEIALELKAAIDESIGFEEQLAKLTDIYNKYEKSLNIEKVLLDLLLFRKGEYIEPIVNVEQITNVAFTVKLNKILNVETAIFDIDNDKRVVALTKDGIDLLGQFLSVGNKVVLENVTIGKTEYIRIKGTDFKLPSIASIENKLKALREAKNTYKLSKVLQNDIDALSKRLGNTNRAEVAKVLIQRYEELVSSLKDLTIALQTNNLEVSSTFDNQMILTETSFDNYVTSETVTISEAIGETLDEIFDSESTSINKVNVFVRDKGSETAVGINTAKSLALAIPKDSMFIQSDMLGHDMQSKYINMQDVVEATFRKFNSDDVLDILDTIEGLLNSTDKVNSLEYEKLKDLFRVELNKKSKVEDTYFKLNLKENTYTLNLIKLTGYQTLQFKLKNGKLEITDITAKDQVRTVTINETIDIFKTRKPILTNNPSINYLKNVGKYIVPKCKLYKVGDEYRYLMPRPIANAVAKAETFTESGKQKSYNLKKVKVKGSITIEAGAFGVSNKVPITLPIGDHLQDVEVKAKLTLDEVSTILTSMLADPQGQVIWSSMNSGVTTFVNAHPDLFIDFTTELHNILKGLFDGMSKDDLNKLLIENDPLLSKLSEEKQIEFLDNIWKNNISNGQNNIDTKSVLFDMLLLQYNNYYLNSSKWLSRRDIEMRLLNDLKDTAKTEKKIVIITSSEQFVNNGAVDLFLVYEDTTKLKEVRNKTYTFNDGSTNEVFKSDAAFEEFTNKRSGYKNQKYFVLDTYISDLINPLIIPVTTTTNTVQPEMAEVESTVTPVQTEIQFPDETRTFILSPKDKDDIQDLQDEFRNNDELTLDKIQEILTAKFVNPDLVMKIMDYFDNDIEFNADEIKYQLLQYKDINLETYNNLVSYIEQKLGVSFNKVSLGKSVYGYNKNNELYLNTDMISADTPIHEALGHPVISYIKENNVELYNNLSSWITDNLNKGSKNGITILYNKVKTASMANNLKLSENNLIEEVMVNYLSRLLTNKALNSISLNVQEYSNTFDELIQGYINDENLDFKLISSNVNISQLANILFHNQNISRILDTIIKSQKESINDTTNLMATSSNSYDYPDNIKSIYNFKQYQFKNSGWSNPLDQVTKQTLNKALLGLSNENEKYTLRESPSVKNSYMIQLNGKDLKPTAIRRQATVSINTTIIDGITDNQIKQDLQEVYIKQDDNLLQIYLKVNPKANEAFTESQNKLYPNRPLNIMFKNLNNISDEDTRFRC